MNNSFVTKCPECGEDAFINQVSTSPIYHNSECWACGYYSMTQTGYMRESDLMSFREQLGVEEE